MKLIFTFLFSILTLNLFGADGYFYRTNGNVGIGPGGSGGGSQTPLTADVNAAGFSIINLGTLSASNANAGTLFVTNPDNTIWIMSSSGTGTNTTLRSPKITFPTNATTLVNLGLDANGNVSTNASAIGGSAAPTTVTQTNFVLNTVYNAGSQAIIISGDAALNGATVSGVAALRVMVDDAGGTDFVDQGGASMSTAVSLALNVTNSFAVPVKASGTYYLTNASSGAGNVASILASSGKIITISSGTNGASAGSNGSNLTNVWTRQVITGGSQNTAHSGGNKWSHVTDYATPWNGSVAPFTQIWNVPGYFSNMTCWTTVQLLSTTNFAFTIQTNTPNTTPVSSALTATLLGSTGIPYTNVTGLACPVGTNTTIVMLGVPTTSIAASTFGWSIEFWTTNR